MLSSLFSYLGPSAKMRRKDLESPESLVPRIKCVYVVPQWIESCFLKFDNYPIQWAQERLSNTSFMLSRLSKVFWSFWFGMSAPLVMYLLGYDHVALLWLCHMTVLLVTVVTLKRFIWRYRPYMVGRAKYITSSLSSSFPSRTLVCVTTYCYLANETMSILVSANNPSQPTTEEEVAPFTGPIPILFVIFGIGLIILASWSEFLMGAHYPTDCIGGVIIGLVVTWMGGLLYDKVDSSYCSAAELYPGSEDINVPSNLPYAALDWLTFFKWILVGCVLITIFGCKAVVNWGRVYHSAGLLLPVAMALSHMSCDALSREQRIPQSVPSSAGYIFGAVVTVFVIHIIFKQCVSKPVTWTTHVLSFIAVFSFSTVAIYFWRTLLPEGEDAEELKEDLMESTVAMVTESITDAME